MGSLRVFRRILWRSSPDQARAPPRHFFGLCFTRSNAFVKSFFAALSSFLLAALAPMPEGLPALFLVALMGGGGAWIL